MQKALGSFLTDLSRAWKIFWRGCWWFLNKHCANLSWLIFSLAMVKFVKYVFDATGDIRVLFTLVLLAYINPTLENNEAIVIKDKE